MPVRRILVAGAVATGAGLVGAFVPSLVPGIAPSYDAVVPVGMLAVFLGAVYVYGRLRTSRRYGTPSERETRPTPPTPGEEFDRRLSDLAPASTPEGKSERAAIRERLESAAVNVLVDEGFDPETARERVETGRWTDDPHAAAFFAVEPSDRRGRLGLGELLGGGNSFERQARRTARVVAARSEGSRE
jgi:hypothetical protein